MGVERLVHAYVQSDFFLVLWDSFPPRPTLINLPSAVIRIVSGKLFEVCSTLEFS